MSIECVKMAVVTLAETDMAARSAIARWAQPADRSEADRRGNAASMRRTLIGRSLVRALVAELTGGDAALCEIGTGSTGKPFVRLPSGESGPAVSISHSGAVVAAAATYLGALGIDVEQHQRHRPFESLAAFAFGPRERAIAGDSPASFYRIWSLREAMSKATGKGLREASDRIDRVTEGPAEGAWTIGDAAGAWLLAHTRPVPDYSLAVAVRPAGAAVAARWSPASVEYWQPENSGARNGRFH